MMGILKPIPLLVEWGDYGGVCMWLRYIVYRLGGVEGDGCIKGGNDGVYCIIV